MIEALQGKYAFVIANETLSRSTLEACPDLRILSRMGAGYDSVDMPAATDLGKAVTVTPGANAPAVAEYTVGLMLAMTRRLGIVDKRTRTGKWSTELGVSVFRKTLGIIGLGAIGKLLAKNVAGFEMRVIAYDPVQDEAFAKENNIEFVPFDQLIRESDFISLHCPYSEENHNIIGQKQLDMMKKGVQIINCARGKLIDEAALYKALVDGKVAGAALDCWEHEPVNMDNPLLKLDNVIVSSHTAGMTYEIRKVVIEVAFRNIIDLSQGKSVRGLVNPEVLTKLQEDK
jgi:D-3-phosphoglycerate dehydrogenase